MGFNWGTFAGNLLDQGGQLLTGYGNKKRSQNIYDSFDSLIETEDNPRRKQMLQTIQSGVDTTLGGNMKGVAGFGALTALSGQQNKFFENDQDMVKTLIQQANQNKRNSQYADAVSGRNAYNQDQTRIRNLEDQVGAAELKWGVDSPEAQAAKERLQRAKGGSGSSGGSGSIDVSGAIPAGVFDQFNIGPYNATRANGI